LDCSETEGKVERGNYFREDEILGKYSPTTDDYYATGYDKGHLIPAGDNTSDSLSMHDSFLMSNVSPQLPSFNRGVWKKLETQVRDWACKFDSLYIITGPVLNNSLPRLGKGKVAIPDYFYKSILLYNKEHQSMITFYMLQYTKDDNLFDFVITTDSLEAILGFDLFPNLEDNAENSLESRIDTTFWKLQ
jgi:endonuclease G